MTASTKLGQCYLPISICPSQKKHVHRPSLAVARAVSVAYLLAMPPKLARQFLSAPEIPGGQAMEVARRLGQRLPERHHGLLPATPAPAVQIDEQPVPMLRLRLGRMRTSYFYDRDPRASSGPVAVAHLGFRYGPIEIDPAERASRIEAFHAGQVYAIKRRQPKEKEARKRLTDLGFTDATPKFPLLDSRHALTGGDGKLEGRIGCGRDGADQPLDSPACPAPFGGI